MPRHRTAGRIAIAVSHQGRSPVPAQQLAEEAGLRGVAVRTDPSTESGTTRVEFVTAFPPVPTMPGNDAEPTAEIHLPGPATTPTSTSESDTGSSSGDSGSSGGSGSGSTEGGEPENQPPVIEDMGLSSEGLATAFLDDALDAGAELRFVDHLKICEGCDHYFQQIRATISLLGSFREPSSLPDHV